jgi:hypothetical protein
VYAASPAAAAATNVAVATVEAVESIQIGSVGVPAPAFAGAEESPPIASEATAIAATFFNEIVFTIFLSFSQIKDDLLSGWWYWDTH